MSVSVLEPGVPRNQLPGNALELMELGFEQKVKGRFDALLLISDRRVPGIKKASVSVIPSSALEVGLISTSPLNNEIPSPERIAALAQFTLGSMWGLPSGRTKAMSPPVSPGDLQLENFDTSELAVLSLRLEDISDERIEEKSEQSSADFQPVLYFRTLISNARGILADVVGYEPWLQPFRLAKLTAAAVVTSLFLFLGAEAWEIGVKVENSHLVIAAAASLLTSTTFIYRGQNMGELIPGNLIIEQLMRTQIVLFTCIFIGMLSLGAIIFIVSFAASQALPSVMLGRWTGVEIDNFRLIKFSLFTATMGLLAGSLGGNLEETEDIKAEYFFDEEH
ncbi:MAG: hypothetical protein P1U58_01370 [Verrucomicrobiales bacterium]|nr:hypothetical protein [Verrucomicrobiales bacterium]